MPTRRMHPVTTAALAATACAILAGCGLGEPDAGATRRFEPDGFGITFQYPFALTEKALRGSGDPAGDSAGDSGAGLPDGVVRELTLTDDDFIAVRRDHADPALLASGMDAVRPEVDQLAKVLDAHVGPSRPITVGGMPGVEYLDSGTDAQQRFLFFLGRDVIYLVHCKSTQKHTAEMAAACELVRRTLRRA